ncbi:hypothetical protein D3C86_1987820 [compost metagenome]
MAEIATALSGDADVVKTLGGRFGAQKVEKLGHRSELLIDDDEEVGLAGHLGGVERALDVAPDGGAGEAGN